MELRYLTTEFKQWDAYVDQHDAGSLYHKTVWKKIIESHFSKKTFYIFAIEDERIKGLVPLVLFSSKIFGTFIISVPFVNYGGMIYSDAQAEQLLFEEIDKLRIKENAEFVELRSLENLHSGRPVKTQKVTFFLDLPESIDELFAGFKAKLRSQIKRPLKENMYAKVGGVELLNPYYDIFCKNMRDLGTPVYSKDFFKTILEYTPENSNIVIVYTKDNIAAGCAFVIGYQERMEIPWASTLKEYNRFSPNMLLYFEVLKLAVEKGYTQFDFGRCTKDGGTFKFKKQWGAIEQQLYWFYSLPDGEKLPEINPNNPKYTLAINMWRKLPLFATKILGPLIVKNLP